MTTPRKLTESVGHWPTLPFLAADDRDMEIAARLVAHFELLADAWEEDAPLWHGWAIH